MTTQEKNKAIAEWLGIELNKYGCPKQEFYISDIDQHYNKFEPNKDRNQQKLIEDKLIKMNCFVQYTYNDFTKKWAVYLDCHQPNNFTCYNKSRDKAFIDAVIELIKSK